MTPENPLNPATECDGCKHVRYVECYAVRKCAADPSRAPVHIWDARSGSTCGPERVLYVAGKKDGGTQP